MSSSAARATLIGLLLVLPACIMFDDRAGVPVTLEMVERIQVGQSTRDDVLAIAGAPTGTYGTNLLATVTRLGASFEPPATPGRIHPDVFTWQQIDVSVRIAFFPILFAWSSSEIRSRTLMVMFNEDGVVTDKAYREDQR